MIFVHECVESAGCNVTIMFTGNKFVAYAQDDDEELVDVEEADTAVKDEGVTEGDDDTGPKASPDAETTILFINPVTQPGSPLGKLTTFTVLDFSLL